jgi:uncharacterized protein (DUF1330 family)
VSAYFIALITIHDEQEYTRYLEGFDEVFDRFRGEVVAVDDDVRVLEGRWPSRRTILIRFPSEELLGSWYDSPEYQRLAVHRQRAADCTIAVVHGRD